MTEDNVHSKTNGNKIMIYTSKNAHTIKIFKSLLRCEIPEQNAHSDENKLLILLKMLSSLGVTNNTTTLPAHCHLLTTNPKIGVLGPSSTVDFTTDRLP